MVRFILATLVMVLYVGVAWGNPEMTGPNTVQNSIVTTIAFGADTEDSEPWGTGGFCTVKVVYGGSGTVQLWQVETATMVASAGTQVGADFTSSTSGGPTTVQPGLPYFKAVASVASPGTTMTVQCSNTSFGAGGGSSGGMLANRPADGSTTFQYTVNDCLDTTCATDGGSTWVTQQWNGAAWVNFTGTGDDLGAGGAPGGNITMGTLDITFSSGDITNGAGSLVDGVDVSAHAARHSDGGLDEIELDNLATTEIDGDLVLSPDTAGGVAWTTDDIGTDDQNAGEVTSTDTTLTAAGGTGDTTVQGFLDGIIALWDSVIAANTAKVTAHVIEDDGTPETQRAALNLIGTAVDCVDNAGTDATDCTITGGGTGHSIEDEATPLTDRAALNFTGTGVTCTDNPGADSTDCDIPSVGGISNIVEDETPQLGADLDGQTFDIDNLGQIFQNEQANADTPADVAGDGRWWVKNDVPNVAMFTDDAGNDFRLSVDQNIVYVADYDGDPGAGNGLGPGGQDLPDFVASENATYGTLGLADQIRHAVAAGCTAQGGNTIGNCDVVLPLGTYDIDHAAQIWGCEDRYDTPASGSGKQTSLTTAADGFCDHDGITAYVANTQIRNMTIRSAQRGKGQIQGSNMGSKTGRCGTTIKFKGDAGDLNQTMFVVDSPLSVAFGEGICLMMNGTQASPSDGLEVATVGVHFTASSSSKDLLVKNFSCTSESDKGNEPYDYTDWNDYHSTCIQTGHPLEEFSEQLDDVRIENVSLHAHDAIVLGNRGVGNVLITNAHMKYGRRGIWNEQQEFTLIGSTMLTIFDGDANDGDADAQEQEMVNNVEAAFVIGTTVDQSLDQPWQSTIMNVRLETEGGQLISTLKPASEASERTTAFTVMNSLLSHGGCVDDNDDVGVPQTTGSSDDFCDYDGTTAVVNPIDYGLQGRFTITGSILGLRGGSIPTGWEYINLSPTTAGAVSYYVDAANFINGAGFGLSTQGAGGTVTKTVNADLVDLTDAYAWTGAHDFTGGSVTIDQFNGLFYTSAYATGSSTDGLKEAMDACEAATPDGGTVIVDQIIEFTRVDITADPTGATLLPPLTICSIEGSSQARIDPSQSNDSIGPARLVITGDVDDDITDPILNIQESWLHASNITIDYTYPTAKNGNFVCIKLGDGTAKTDIDLDNVSCRTNLIYGDTNGSVGLQVGWVMKSNWKGGQFSGFDDGVQVTDLINGSTFDGMDIRSNQDGIDINSASQGTHFVTMNSSIENNNVGIHVSGGSSMRHVDYATHFENTAGCSPSGCATNYNLHIETNGYQFSGFGTKFGGGNLLTPGHDIVRTAGMWHEHGPDTCTDCTFGSGATYVPSAGADDARLRLIGIRDGPNWVKWDDDPSNNSFIWDGPYDYVANDCDVDFADQGLAKRGSRCWEYGTETEWECTDPEASVGTCTDVYDTCSGSGSLGQPPCTQDVLTTAPDNLCDQDAITDATTEAIYHCDVAAEFTAVDARDHAWTGAHTFDEVFVNEGAAADDDVAGDGQWWVLNDATGSNMGMFTGEQGVDTVVSGGQTFYAVNYDSDASVTGGIQEAIDACIAASGGTVQLPRGTTTISAAGTTAPVIDLKSIDSGARIMGPCELVGYGSVNVTDAAEVESGSTILITGVDTLTADTDWSRKIGIHMAGTGQKIRNFTLAMTPTTGETTVSAIMIASDAGSTPTVGIGEQGISDWVIEDVTITGEDALLDGVGLHLNFALKGTMSGGAVKNWGTAILFGNETNALYGALLRNNVNLFDRVAIRENDIGIDFDNAGSCAQVTLDTTTNESNTKGIFLDSLSSCQINDYGSHYENANGINIELDSTIGQYHGFGTRFRGSGTMAAGDDITRTTAQSAGIGGDTCIGCYWQFGSDYTAAGGKLVRMADAQIVGGATFTGGDQFVVPADGDDVTWTGAHTIGTGGSLGVTGSGTINSTTVTITDNESEDLGLAMVFRTDVGAATADVGLESDGDLTYNPSTGLLSATSFSAVSTTLPSASFDDSDFTGTEAKIVVNAPTDNDGEMSLQVESGNADVFYEAIVITTDGAGATTTQLGDHAGGAYVSIDEAGLMSFVSTADIDLPDDSVDTADITDANVTEDKLAASLVFDATDLLNLSGIDSSTATEGLILPQIGSACAGATAEGQICWDSVGEMLYVGDAVGGPTAINSGGGTHPIAAGDYVADSIDADDLNGTLTMGATDVVTFAANDSTTGALIIPQVASACAGATVAGEICWDTAADTLYVGDGVGGPTAISGGGGLGTSLTSTTNDILSDTTTTGAIVLGSNLGGGTQEALTLDFDTTDNVVGISSTTGVETIDIEPSNVVIGDNVNTSTLIFDQASTDVILTATTGNLNVSTGALQVGGNTVLTAASTVSALTTVGTIDTGTWQGDAVTATYLDLTTIDGPTLGNGTPSIWSFDAGAVDPSITFDSNSINFQNAATFTLGGNPIMTNQSTSSAINTLTGASLTLGDGGDFSTITIDAGASDPVFTTSSGVVNLSTGALQVGGSAVLNAASTTGGSNLTDVDAATGDSATAFFDAGTLEVARGGTGITSLGTGVASWMGTPSSANLASAVTDEEGSGVLVFATSPSLTTPVLGAASATSITVTSQTECVMLDAAGINCSTTNGCATGDVAGTNFDYTTADFDTGATEEDGAWTFELPANLTGTTATWQAVWMSNNAACDGGATADVCWAIDGDSYANDAIFNTGALGGTIDGETDKCLANGDIMYGPVGTFTHSMVASQRAAVVIVRDTDGTNCAATAGNDDLAADASLLAVRFCYEVDNVFSGE